MNPLINRWVQWTLRCERTPATNIPDWCKRHVLSAVGIVIWCYLSEHGIWRGIGFGAKWEEAVHWASRSGERIEPRRQRSGEKWEEARLPANKLHRHCRLPQLASVPRSHWYGQKQESELQTRLQEIHIARWETDDTMEAALRDVCVVCERAQAAPRGLPRRVRWKWSWKSAII